MNAKRGGGSRVKIVRKTLADGTVKEYRYDLNEQAQRRFHLSQRDGIHKLAQSYYASPEFRGLSERWQKATRYYVGIIEERLGWMTLRELSDRRARAEIYELRDSCADYPAKADKLMNVLRTIIGWGYERAMVDANHAIGIGRLSPSGPVRSDKIWTPELEQTLLAVATSAFRELFRFALFTAGRQSDLIGLKWSNFNAGWISWQPAKTVKSTGIWVHLPAYALDPLRELMVGLSRCSDYILTTDQGRPWSAENVKKHMRIAKAKAGLGDADLTFHDIRGTTATRLLEAGATDAETEAVLGHTFGRGLSLRDYAARSKKLALNAYLKWNAAMKGDAQVIPIRQQ
jgi:integrase